MNRLQLTEDVDWWPSEVIHEGHVQATLAGGHAEVMLTHDSAGPPYCTEPVADILENNPWGWPAPLLLAHGHFHVAGQAVVRLPGAAHETTIWSSGRQPGPGQRQAARPRHLDGRERSGRLPMSGEAVARRIVLPPS